jgi:Tfp pilus assembly protein PilN
MRIEDMGELKQKSFFQLFDALAKADSDDVWLTTFIVNENDLSISGSLAKPSALTKWIGELSNTPFFNGQEFDDALIIRGDQGLTFHLTSTQKTSDLLAGKGAKNASE